MTAEFPRAGARNVSTATDVVATFSEPVRGVDEGTFMLRRASTGARVAAIVFSRGDSDTWTLRPDHRLRAGTRYRVMLFGGRFDIHDRAGNALFDTDWSFTTRGRSFRSDVTRPRVVSEFPRDAAVGVSRFTDVRVTFSERVRAVTSRTLTLVPSGSSRTVAADVLRAGTGNRWILEPATRLARGTRYTVVARGGAAGIRDLAGNRLVTTSWGFRTG